MDSNGQRDDDSTVKDNGAQWQCTARGQLNGEGQCIGGTTTMDNKDGASAMAILTRPTMEATKANAVSRD